ncbi:uncharacterized protein LOC126298537 isoform X2 [Schistocerca gregaria]|uniref:uncharacterized protein LOC126298537 isoform X1 n=1 Tax=Schistocerca gregaria TaxID=7010 RepID=UPI00211E0AED|nr:uncharacterized protein LOC126298537 isoform X1 [Schistocerca gregaria]XP_049845855.1 uncharacterized protein LOC126298537 isoform X2 [Schistocerca gregaria]
MASNYDDSTDRFMREYAKIRDKCLRECIPATRLYSELRPIEIRCIKYFVVNGLREAEKAKIKKIGRIREQIYMGCVLITLLFGIMCKLYSLQCFFKKKCTTKICSQNFCDVIILMHRRFSILVEKKELFLQNITPWKM